MNRRHCRVDRSNRGATVFPFNVAVVVFGEPRAFPERDRSWKKAVPRDVGYGPRRSQGRHSAFPLLWVVPNGRARSLKQPIRSYERAAALGKREGTCERPELGRRGIRARRPPTPPYAIVGSTERSHLDRPACWATACCKRRVS